MGYPCKKKIKKLLPMSKAKEDGKIKTFLYVQFIVLLVSSIALLAANSAYLGMETKNFCAYSMKEDPATNATEIDKWAKHYDIDFMWPGMKSLSEKSLSDMVDFYNDTDAQLEMTRSYFFGNFSEEFYNLSRWNGYGF